MATKSTASKTRTARPKKEPAATPQDTSQHLEVTIKDALVALLKAYGIKEGHWVLDTKMGMARTLAQKPNEDDAYPATILVMEGLRLTKVGDDDNLLRSANTVDASVI